MISLEKSNCCGCGSCADICPVGAIALKEDEEGFLYPSIQEEKCINCDKCIKICPIQGFQKSALSARAGYIVQHRNEEIRRQSTSGGAFTAIANAILREGGVVFGAAFDKNFVVRHMPVDNESALSVLRNSKYVQSDISQVYAQIREFLADGRVVCFSGTPCQVGAVRKQFPNKENLYFVDVICREVTSQKLLKKYIGYQESRKGKQVRALRFRDKYYGYHYPVMDIEFSDGSHYRRPLHYDPYLRAFFSNVYSRYSCYKCPYRKGERFGDLTLYDALDISDCSHLIKNDLGATKVIVNSEKGLSLFQSCKKVLRIEEVSAQKLLNEQADSLINISEILKERMSFWKDAQSLRDKDLFQKYYPLRLVTVRLRFLLKMMIYKLGLIKAKKQ